MSGTIQDLIDALEDVRAVHSVTLKARLVVETPDGIGFVQGIETGNDEDGPYAILVVRS